MLTRADLASIAGTLDLGLRAGERRYALLSLLSQDPVGVLRALAVEARRQGVMHEGRVECWGAGSDFLAGRARTTAELLEQLATQGFDPPAEGAEAPAPADAPARTAS